METEKFFNKLNEVKEEVKMTKDEKDFIRKNLLNHMKGPTPLVSPYSNKKLQYAALSAFILFSGTAVSFAAQNSLPGDLLYGVKVGINERVGRMLAINDVDKANYEITLANRRLEETVALKAKGTLNNEINTKLQNNFNEHTVIAQTEIIKVSGSGQATASVVLTENLNDSIEHAKNIFGIIEATATEKANTGVQKIVPGIINKANNILHPSASTLKTQLQPIPATTSVHIDIPAPVPAPNPLPETVNTNSQTNTNINANVNTSVNNTVQQVVPPVTNSVQNTLNKIGI